MITSEVIVEAGSRGGSSAYARRIDPKVLVCRCMRAKRSTQVIFDCQEVVST
jgi:hypothetical protein